MRRYGEMKGKKTRREKVVKEERDRGRNKERECVRKRKDERKKIPRKKE
jgi:hypothetical protein